MREGENKMNNLIKVKLYTKLWEKFKTVQLDILIEEMAELTQAVKSSLMIGGFVILAIMWFMIAILVGKEVFVGSTIAGSLCFIAFVIMCYEEWKEWEERQKLSIPN